MFKEVEIVSKLIITEKPSVAQGYAKVLGVHGRQKGYLEGGSYIISWCVGQMMELAEPEQHDRNELQEQGQE